MRKILGIPQGLALSGLAITLMLFTLTTTVAAQTAPASRWQPAYPTTQDSFLSRLAISGRVSSLGIGFEVATPLW